MRTRSIVAAGLVAVGLGYLGSPYAALYRLNAAARHGDVAVLAATVDWGAVREGVVEDICDAAALAPAPRVQQASATDSLPPFGASFFSGIAASAVEEKVTPEGVAALAMRRGAEDGSTMAALGWSFFDGPFSFTARVRLGADDPALIHMQLRRDGWHVVRVELPPAVLAGQLAHT